MIPLFVALLFALLASQQTTSQNPDYFDEIQCENPCHVFDLVNSSIRCTQCPLGRTGESCEKIIELKRPRFNGTGYLGLAHLRNAEKMFNISLTFRPQSPDGLLLFSAQTMNADKDFFSVVIKNGFVVFRYDCGSGLMEIKSSNKVNLNVWNTLIIRRRGKSGKIKLNNEYQVEGRSPGDQEEMTLNLNLYVGGCHFMSHISSRIDTTRHFVGCIHELLISGQKLDFGHRHKNSEGQSEFGINVDECNNCHPLLCKAGGVCQEIAEKYVCLCQTSYYGDTCQNTFLIDPIWAIQFAGYSYMKMDHLGKSLRNHTDIEIVFKPSRADGMLLYKESLQKRRLNFISLSLHGGIVEFRFDLGSGPAVLRSSKPISVGSWHIVRASRTCKMGILLVDDQTSVTGNSKGSDTGLSELDLHYLGGHPAFDKTARHANVSQNFTGCIQMLLINTIPSHLLSYHFKNERNGRVVRNTFGINPCSQLCAGRPCGSEEYLYRRLLYQLSGVFSNGQVKEFRNNIFHSSSPNNYELNVRPVNTNLTNPDYLPNFSTYYVTQVLSGVTYRKFLMTLRYFPDRLVEIKRYQFHSHLNVNWASSFNTMTWSSFNAEMNDCGGFVYLMNFSNFIGTINNCDINRDVKVRLSPRQFYLNMNCSSITVMEGSNGNYKEHTLHLQRRFSFPSDWKVDGC